jgi:hypothetical protein
LKRLKAFDSLHNLPHFGYIFLESRCYLKVIVEQQLEELERSISRIAFDFCTPPLQFRALKKIVFETKVASMKITALPIN